MAGIKGDIPSEIGEGSKQRGWSYQDYPRRIQCLSGFAPISTHLHIDILPEGQGKGFGAKLIKVFLNKLKALNVSGVHLGVGKENQRATAWYPRQGFVSVEENETSTIYAMQL